jgi:uncharacterized membrane protein
MRRLLGTIMLLAIIIALYSLALDISMHKNTLAAWVISFGFATALSAFICLLALEMSGDFAELQRIENERRERERKASEDKKRRL